MTPGATEPVAVAPAVRCSPSSDRTIAMLQPSESVGADAPCGVALELHEAELTLRSIPIEDPEPNPEPTPESKVPLATGPVPEGCGDALERCELWGVHDELGPVLLAAERGPESEVPVQVYVGWVEDRRLVFAPTWYGLSSVADHTRVGAPWALAPYDCDGVLKLLPAPRLPEAEVETPSESVRAAAGRWSIGEDGTAVPSEAHDPTDATPLDAARCRPVFDALP